MAEFIPTKDHCSKCKYEFPNTPEENLPMASHRLTTGCKHEHILVDAGVCQPCFNRLMWLGEFNAHCSLCRDSAQPHECEVTLHKLEKIT